MISREIEHLGSRFFEVECPICGFIELGDLLKDGTAISCHIHNEEEILGYEHDIPEEYRRRLGWL